MSKIHYSQAYINGEWISTGNTFPVINPATGEEIAQVADCDRTHAKQAIQAAHGAYATWGKTTAELRARLLKKWHNFMTERLEELARLLTIEQGKPLAEARTEIAYGASFIEWFAEEARRTYGDIVPGHASDKRITVIKQPIGVVAAISPWNFPNAMIARKVAPALAAGCTVVVKPSDLTPLSALAMTALAEEAGIPKGVINVITCQNPADIGDEFTTNPLVRKISVTGSTIVGKLLLKKSADQVKRVSLELGGNAPFIVFGDADIDAAVAGCMASKFRNAGQTCVSSNRIFVHRDIAEEFNQKLAGAISDLRTGNGMEDETEIGPLINEHAVAKCEHLLSEAIEKGAEMLVGGKRQNGLFFSPTLVSGITREMAIFDEEIFGPVAPVILFESEDEVLDMANDTPYGLAAYFYGRDYAQIWRVAEALEYGMVGINTGAISTTVAPFGGIKESGFGREGSRYGIEDYINVKYMCWGGIG